MRTGAVTTRTGAARRDIVTFGAIAHTTPIKKNTRAATTASVGTLEAKTDLETRADGARNTEITKIMAKKT